MAGYTVLGVGPISFTSSTGSQLLIPLETLTFDATAQIQLDAAFGPIKAQLLPWLNYLVSTGTLSSGPPLLAIVLTAADPGPGGNNIQVEFSGITPDAGAPNDQTKTTFTATLTETSLYDKLSYDPASPNFIKSVLGTESNKGSNSGLVHVKDADNPSKPKAGAYTLTGGNNNTAAGKKVDGDPNGDAFNLEAKKVGADGNNTTVTISQVDDTTKTFKLEAVWTTTIKGIKLADLPGKLAGASYEINVDPPPGKGYSIPAAGKVMLGGGSGGGTPTAASAVVPAY